MTTDDGPSDARRGDGWVAVFVRSADEAGYALMDIVLVIAPFLLLIAIYVASYGAALWIVVYIGRLLGFPSGLFSGIVAIAAASFIGLLFPGMARCATDFYRKRNA
jgi:hypothetical protein